MTGRTDAEVAGQARRLLPINRGSWVPERARAALHDGQVRLGTVGTMDLVLPDLWDYGIDRARGRHVHGFTFLTDWVGAGGDLDGAEQERLAELIHSLFRAWDEDFGRARGTAPEMAFHDETTAQRMLGLVAALDALRFAPEQEAFLRDLAERTAEVLLEPAFHSGVNNHGMFQDLALLTWSVLLSPEGSPLGDLAWERAAERLHTYFATCFTSEGVHVENTPTYHVMVARYLPMLDDLFTAAQSSEAELYDQLLRGAIDYAVHCVTPEELYPPVSDTHRRRLDSAVNLETFAGGEFEYATSGGRSGTEPSRCTAVFPASGYAMTRSRWGDPNATFVHFTSSYNADYHKHSDELSVYLRSGGRDLLCEAGAYGYNWKDPFTKYAYSSAAHNSLMVAGTGLPRTEPAQEREDPENPLNRLEISTAEDDLLVATGSTRRFRGRHWTRRLVARHGDEPEDTTLRLEDRVESTVGAADLRFLWHLGPGLRVVLRAQGAEVFDRGTKVMEIEFSAAAEYVLHLAEGVESPAIQGWYFPQLGEKVSAPVISLETRAAQLELTTEVRLADFVWDAPTSNPFDTLVLSGRTIPTWESAAPPTPGAPSVLLLSPYSGSADRERLVGELVRAGRHVQYVPDIARLVGHAGSQQAAEVAVGELARAAHDLILRAREGGLDPIVATVGSAFAPGALAALATRVPLLAVDPELPFPAPDPRSSRLVARLSTIADEGGAAAVELLVSDDGRAQLPRAVAALGSAHTEQEVFPSVLRADLEDVAGGTIANLLDARDGIDARYLAVYDRRSKEFIVRIPLVDEVEISVRVFHGKDEVLSLPYRPGAEQTVPYEGRIGPHRLRLHLRVPGTDETVALTTGVIRVR